MIKSIQHKLGVVRPPRVNITFDVETAGAIEKKELPFVVGVLANLSGHQTELPLVKDRKFIEIDNENFDEVLASYKPFLKLTVNNAISGEGTIEVELPINSIDSFSPSNILNIVPEIKELYDSRILIVDLMSKIDGNYQLDLDIVNALEEKKIDKIDDVVSKMRNTDPERGKLILENFNKFLSEEKEDITTRNSYLYLSGIIAKIDEKLSKQMDEIIHNPDYASFESTVRGLKYLTSNTSTGSKIKIRVMNISKKELFEDLERAVDFDQSQMFKKIYEEEYGTLGGKPYSCLIGAYDFGPNPTDIEILRKISGIAAAAHAPFLSAVNAQMFGMESFDQLGAPRDLHKIFESSELAKWNGFRNTEDSRYVSLLLPRVLVRNVYGKNFMPVEEFDYEENVISETGGDEKYCWGNPAFFLAQRITAAFESHGWVAAIRGFEGGGLVEDLPMYSYKSPDGEIVTKCPTETVITDRREKELSDLGFISICYRKDSDSAVFFGVQTAQNAKQYTNNLANSNAALSARLTYILNSSRFAHYIKIMMRDKIGSFVSSSQIQRYVQNWLAEYILLSDEADQSSKAKYPLREGSVKIVEDEANPGGYRAIIYLRPHFQLESINVSIRLVAKLPVDLSTTSTMSR